MGFASLVFMMKLVELNSCLPTSFVLVSLDGGSDGSRFYRMLELGGLLHGGPKDTFTSLMRSWI